MRAMAGQDGRLDLVRRGLESAWRRAWDARARAAACGDYAAAERWHRRALALGARLAPGDRPPAGGRLPAVHAG